MYNYGSCIIFQNDYVTNDGWKKGRIPQTDLTWRTWKTLDNGSFIREKSGWDIENNGIMNFLDNVFDLQNYFERKNIPRENNLEIVCE